jgi:hypothetical protein
MSKLRAKMAIQKMVEKGGKPMPMSKALIAVGYSPAYAHNPQKFANSKTAQQLMDQYLPDELIAKTHQELLTAGTIQHYCFPKLSDHAKKSDFKGELTNDEIKKIVESVPGCRLIYVKRDFMGAWAFYEAPDTKSRRDAVDMAYKRKGDYAAEKIELTKRKYQDLSNKELAEREALLKKFLLKK